MDETYLVGTVGDPYPEPSEEEILRFEAMLEERR